MNAVPGGPPPAKRSQHAAPMHVNARGTPLDHPAVVAGNAGPAGAAGVMPPLAAPLNGRAGLPHPIPPQAQMSRSNARKQVMSWMDAPDDVYFRATEQTK